MGRFRQASDDDGETAIDISPLIDCVFILLIFFIVTTVFVEETGVEVDKPQSSGSASDLESNSILIAITAEGKVIYGKKTISPKQVDGIVKRETSANPDMPIIIQADSESPHGVFAEVYDVAKAAKRDIKISFATKREN